MNSFLRKKLRRIVCHNNIINNKNYLGRKLVKKFKNIYNKNFNDLKKVIK